MNEIFNWYAIENHRQSRNENVLLFVKHAQESLVNDNDDSDPYELIFLQNQIAKVQKQIHKGIPSIDDLDSDIYGSFRAIYRNIVDNWNILNDKSYTYRLLACMARIQTWEDDPETRMALFKTLCAAAGEVSM